VLACAPATAQVPVAPEPHLALAELVKGYKRFELPLPPANAELVRIKQSVAPYYQFGFRVPPRRPDGVASYLIGASDVREAEIVEPIKPDRTALEGIELVRMGDLLCLVAQCSIRGQDEFAELLYARIRERTRCTRADVMGKWGLRIYDVWHPRIWWPDSDRKEVLRFLKEVVPEGNADIRDLERTVAPRKSKPGTVEFLIDDLTDYWHRPEGWVRPAGVPPAEWERGEEAYLKLAELGFDAVPALLEHLDDQRFTRAWSKEPTLNGLLRGASSYPIRVGHVAGQLLDDLSNGWTEYWMEGEKWGDPKQAREWLVEARKVGEEKWLADHVLPALYFNGKGQEPVDGGGAPNKAIARTLGAKYPARLAEAYRTVLHKRQLVESEVLARAIVLSKLTPEQKLELLEAGAKHKQPAHRYAALDVLADLDRSAFHKNLIEALKAHPEENFVGLVRRTDDPACWETLAATARRGSVKHRLEVIDGMRHATTPDQDKKTRRERLRFLVGLLNDEAALGKAPDPFSFGGEWELQVRDFAALTLARKLDFWKVEFDPHRGPVSRLFIRAAVAKVIAEELAHGRK
jgi:hypothetical protein